LIANIPSSWLPGHLHLDVADSKALITRAAFLAVHKHAIAACNSQAKQLEIIE